MLKKTLTFILNRVLSSPLILFESDEELAAYKEYNNAFRFSEEWRQHIVLKIVNIIVVMLIGALIFGCAAPTSIEYKPVAVPVKCEVPDVQRPSRTGDVVEDTRNIVKYTEQVESALDACK